MDRTQFIQMIGAQLIKKLKELELEHDDIDLLELLNHHASIRIIPMDQVIPVADEAVKRKTDSEFSSMVELQNDILAFVSEELKKERKPELLN